MENCCYWLNPDHERQKQYSNYMPISSISRTASLKSMLIFELLKLEVLAEQHENRQCKRRKVSHYCPNQREQASNSHHAELLPMLKSALEAFEQWRSFKIGLPSVPSQWIAPQDTYQHSTELRVQINEGTGRLLEMSSASWVMLERMRSTVKPKFVKKDASTQNELKNLFGELHSNTHSEEVVCYAYDQEIIMPKDCCFLMSDISLLRTNKEVLQENGLFDLILVDIPWENKSVHRSQKYTTIPNRQLLSLPIAALLKQQEVSFACFWLTNRLKLREYFYEVLLPSWEFSPIALWYWLKVDALGEVVSTLESNHRRPYETLVITISKSLSVNEPGLSAIPRDLVLVSPRQEHSRKPPIAQFLLKSLWKDVTEKKHCLEMFARELTPGWTSWGNEVLYFQDSNRFSSFQGSLV